MNKNINPEEVNELACKVTQIQSIIQLQNNQIEFIPPLSEIDSPSFCYAKVYGNMANIHEVNQDLLKELENVVVKISEIADELEEKEQ